MSRSSLFNCYNISICKKEKLKDETSKQIHETNGGHIDLRFPAGMFGIRENMWWAQPLAGLQDPDQSPDHHRHKCVQLWIPTIECNEWANQQDPKKKKEIKAGNLHD